jgi:3-oxoacyl-[acyl-carrier-protein] synthase II
MKSETNDIRVVVTGLGVVSGLGLGIEETWNKVADNGTAISEKDNWEIEGPKHEYFGTCCDLGFATHFPDITGMSPLRYSQLALLGCKLALEDAKLDLTSSDNSRTGLIINSDLGANTAAENYALKLYDKGPARVSPFDFTKSVANCVIGDVARQFKLTGPSSFIIGENSISYGIDLIKNGKADIMVCGGFDEVRERTVWNYSRRNLTKPVNGHLLSEKDFSANDKSNHQMVFGEGSCFVVIESEAHAKARQAKIYAEVLGEYSSCDSLCNEIIWERDSSDLGFTMKRALKLSEVEADKISFIVGASCMPWQLLSYEIPAITEVWNDTAVKYTTVKSRIGETFSSGPAISFSLAAAALYNKEIPAIGWEKELWKENGSHVQVLTEKVGQASDYCLVNSIQVGGNTTAIVLKSYSDN